jgi:hypothetical protein
MRLAFCEFGGHGRSPYPGAYSFERPMPLANPPPGTPPSETVST